MADKLISILDDENIGAVREVLASGVDVNLSHSNGVAGTALHCASTGHPKCVVVRKTTGMNAEMTRTKGSVGSESERRRILGGGCHAPS